MFDFESRELAFWDHALSRSFGRVIEPRRRKPIGQLVRSMLGCRTRDEVALHAYHRLGRRWPKARDLARASPAEVEREIRAVTFAEAKAEHLPAALGRIEADFPGFRLDRLAAWPVEAARAALERYPGVGQKVAASTLNASTLRRPIFIVDSHVHRVMIRFGTVSDNATARAASELVTISGHALGADGMFQLFRNMKRLGQTICRFEAPDCSTCPLASRCRTAGKRSI
ncbi:hypothetical protein RCO27_09430 [Sphingosinicella sp. LHD-64]|uniref:endonuclease III domain-containing protein n=1 Tax=Sphingosinicella sp. LHD-64 TaxID=3072139 RepID=UPI00280D7892|nr:hypothetical protein [Sphingosinicella sp. LHD-64]MDQ8756450.1 hypothetical protein [Sphingosinicella sp. LHD-64]